MVNKDRQRIRAANLIRTMKCRIRTLLNRDAAIAAGLHLADQGISTGTSWWGRDESFPHRSWAESVAPGGSFGCGHDAGFGTAGTGVDGMGFAVTWRDMERPFKKSVRGSPRLRLADARYMKRNSFRAATAVKLPAEELRAGPMADQLGQRTRSRPEN